MSLDTSDVHSAIRKIETDMRRLQADVEQLRRAIDDRDPEAAPTAEVTLADVGLTLPPEIIVRRSAEIAAYLSAHPDLTEVLGDMAAALADEFRDEPSEIELVLYQDPEIDDRQLTLYVRVPEYDDTLSPRLDAVWERVDSRYPPTYDWVMVATDYHPMQQKTDV